jgi:hypothetical protein
MFSNVQATSGVLGSTNAGSGKTVTAPSAWQQFLQALLRGLAMAAA